ncbi:helix-turn-helix domain-containing protein [Furfurilactobacillus siliginis]|uniref:HTH cro/C1-type domain-containing protein n=1 Tax=Furfurilactobacillus siliginis TaxID=348151 RepID=A0A0R2L7G2_9LACO|nr:helix-turn-helix transcriptional regulator [Furfurilactobacillus siliginis]KRN94516.1 hypothetical protein IV55_GL000502 [Furfurilactobacillus siliginis]GEK28557.1 hypothetical protein LSI01_08680 [Furfurilactobacillus siliginis]
MNNTIFQQNLIKLRKQSQLSQSDLAEQLNISRQSISKWENGETTPDLTSLVKLTEVLHVDLDELVLNKHPQTDTGLKSAIKKATTPDKADQDWHENHRWRQWYYQPITNGWEFLARYYWIVLAIIGMLGWLVWGKR